MSKPTALTRWVGPELEACELTHFERAAIDPGAAYAEHVAYLDAPRRPPPPPRRGEVAALAPHLPTDRKSLILEDSCTLDGAAVIVCGETVYVGWFTRTNHAGPKRLAHLLFPHGYRVKGVEVTGCLHLKLALTGVASGLLLANPVWANLKRVGGMEVLDEYKDMSFNSKELGRGRSLLGGEAGDKTGDVGEQQDKTKWALEMGA